jgi:ABC-2 type transport system ATP-binding protein
MSAIVVSHLKKYYQVHKKEPGFAGSLKSLFHREYFDAKAVDDISFTIQPGELVGFIGPNGAGKTTTLKCLSGLLYPTSGQVKVLGHTPSERKPAYLKQIALVMGQKNQLWWDLPARESFALNREIYEVDMKSYQQRVDELSELLDVKDILDIQVRKLSLGQRMKCELISALIHTPKILFLDEPTIGLDIMMQENLRSFIKDYNKKHNATVILTSHYMKDVEELCERVIMIDHGKLLYDGSLAQIIKKYAKEKVLSIVFETDVKKEVLQKFGEIASFTPRKVTIKVESEKSNTVASKLLQDFPVEDLTIEEPSMDDVIKDAFSDQIHA